MGQTALSQLPYPDATEQPYVHLDLKDLADKVDEQLQVTCTSATRPAHKVGRRIYESDTKLEFISDGTSWLFSGTWTGVAWGAGGSQLTANWTASTVNPCALAIPHAGKYLVSVMHGLSLSIDKAVPLDANLFVGDAPIGPFAVNSASATAIRTTAGLASFTFEYTRLVDLPVGNLQSRVKSSSLGGTQSHAACMVQAVRVG